MTEPEAKTKQGQVPVEDVPCLACGCLCDDVVLTLEHGQIVEARNACELGRLWFLADHRQADLPAATIEGRPVDLVEALDCAAAILRGAKAPVVCGLSASTIEAQRLAVAIADQIGAVFDPGHSLEALPRVLATQRNGAISATLGEVRQRAEVVLFWGVDPVQTHPRLWEKVIEPRDPLPTNFLKQRRSVIAVDQRMTETLKRADLPWIIEPGQAFETLWALRALLGQPARGDLEPGEPSTTEIQACADRLRSARYGAIFYSYGEWSNCSATVEALQSLALDLNETTRFVTLPLLGPGNPAGAEAVSTWQAGAPLAIDFSQGHPRFLPEDAQSVRRFEHGEADAVLCVGDLKTFEKSLANSFDNRPVIQIGPAATAQGKAAVAIASATTGINTSGTVVRFDGVSLPLRPALPADRPTEAALLDAILNGIKGEGVGRAQARS